MEGPFFAIGNYVFAAIWIGLGLFQSARAFARCKGLGRRTRIGLVVVGGCFAAFGASDVAEARYGAWWRHTWLLTWKLTCLAVGIVVGLLIAVTSRRRRTDAPCDENDR